MIYDLTKNSVFIDFDWKAVIFQKKRNVYINLICGDAIKSPFKPGSFDKIVARYVIHNFPGHEFRKQFYKEAARLIRENGEMILGMVPNRKGMFFDLKNYINPKLRHRLAKDHFMFWPLSIKKMKEELHNLGFEFVHIRKTPEPPTEKIYYRFCEAARRFFLPVILNKPIIHNYVDIKFKKASRY